MKRICFVLMLAAFACSNALGQDQNAGSVFRDLGKALGDAAGGAAKTTPEPKNAVVDPATPSAKIKETMVQIRRVEELDKLEKELEALRQENVELKKAKDALSKQLIELNTQLAQQKTLIEQLNASIAKTTDVQNKTIASLQSRFDDLEASLKEIPKITLQGAVTSGSEMAALVEIDGKSRVVRKGEVITLAPTGKGESSVTRTVQVKEITVDSVIMEMNPSGQQFVVK